MQQYVRLTQAGKKWFGANYTEGKIYTFPIMYNDKRHRRDLNKHPEEWAKEFIFVTEAEYLQQEKKENYSIY